MHNRRAGSVTFYDMLYLVLNTMFAVDAEKMSQAEVEYVCLHREDNSFRLLSCLFVLKGQTRRGAGTEHSLAGWLF